MNPSHVYEHVYAAPNLADGIRYWQQFGWEESGRGRLSSADAEALYGVPSALESARLRYRTPNPHSFIRVMAWERPLSEGLEYAPPLAVGSRWTAMRTANIMLLRDAYHDEAEATGRRVLLSPLARVTDPSIAVEVPSFYETFRGFRIMFVITPYHRHVVLERVNAGGIAPGDFADDAPLPVGPPTHADLVARGSAGMGFYPAALGLVAKPLATSKPQAGTLETLMVGEETDYQVHGFDAPGISHSGLNIYAMGDEMDDLRERSRPGHLGLCLFTFRYPAGALQARRDAVQQAGATDITNIRPNEFGEPSFTFTAPDGIVWTALE